MSTVWRAALIRKKKWYFRDLFGKKMVTGGALPVLQDEDGFVNRNRDLIDNFYHSELRDIFEYKMWRRNLEAEELIQSSYRKYTGADREHIHTMDLPYLMDFFRQGETLDSQRLMICTHLLKEEADLLAIQGFEKESRPLYQKAFHLFIETYRAHREFDFEKHIGILIELENKVPPEYITDEVAEIIDILYESFE